MNLASLTEARDMCLASARKIFTDCYTEVSADGKRALKMVEVGPFTLPVYAIVDHALPDEITLSMDGKSETFQVSLPDVLGDELMGLIADANRHAIEDVMALQETSQ